MAIRHRLTICFTDTLNASSVTHLLRTKQALVDQVTHYYQILYSFELIANSMIIFSKSNAILTQQNIS